MSVLHTLQTKTGFCNLKEGHQVSKTNIVLEDHCNHLTLFTTIWAQTCNRSIEPFLWMDVLHQQIPSNLLHDLVSTEQNERAIQRVQAFRFATTQKCCGLKLLASVFYDIGERVLLDFFGKKVKIPLDLLRSYVRKFLNNGSILKYFYSSTLCLMLFLIPWSTCTPKICFIIVSKFRVGYGYPKVTKEGYIQLHSFR